MKQYGKRILALALCLALCLGLLPAMSPQVRAADGDKIKIACIGDSITYGHNPADGGATQIRNNWPTVMGQVLGEDYDVRNFGQNGITLSKQGGTPVWNIQRFTDSKNFQPDAVIIMLGTNDSPGSDSADKQESLKADLRELITVYRELDSQPKVYIATCATGFGNGGFGLPPANIHNYIVPLQKEVAEEMDCPIIDVHEFTSDMGAYFPDNIHPNEEGHRMMGEFIAQAYLDDPIGPPPEPQIPIYEDKSYSFAERAADLVARMSMQQKASQLVERAAAIPASQLGGGALNVPATKDLSHYSWWAEALHGLLRDNENPQSEGTKDNVSYAQSLTMGSTWNPELYYEGATMISDEIRERSRTNDLGNCINLNFYSPTINMQRDPRWGRNEESYSEDPYLTGVMGTQFVLGMEGKDQNGDPLDPDGYMKTLTTIKHYTANNTESNRTSGGADVVDLRALREYYVAPYRDVIRSADARSVMTAYSWVNREPCSYSSYLMDTLLRQTFGFTGHITSDCDSAKTIANLNYTNPRTGAKLTAVEQMAGALAHGEDLECNSGISANVGDYNALASQMVSSGVQTDKGTFTENTIDIAAHRLMTARISTGEFDEDNGYTAAANARKAEQAANGTNNYTPERIAVVDKEVEEGVVMLKNNGLLPLQIPASGEYKVVIIGEHQTSSYLGLYSSEQRHAEDDKWRIWIGPGIEQAIKEINPDATVTRINSNSISNQSAIEAADAVVVVVGTGSGDSAEGRDRSSIALSSTLTNLINNVAALNPNTVAVMETCGPVQVTTFENNVAAILWSSFGGIRKGIGFAHVLTGQVNPSGHLTATWYQKDADLPAKTDYNLYATNGSHGRTYMYYDNSVPVSYPFGYGLSYTSFEYSNLRIAEPELDLTALEAAIAAAGELNKDEYTEESWAALEEALAAAEAAKTAETQAEIDAAKDDLLEAIEKLEKTGPVEPPFLFDDVTNPDKFYYDSVYWAYNHEPQITKGTTDTLFGPDDPCTRGQVVTFLYRAAGEPEITGGNNPFTDVKEGKYYYNAVLWAVGQGITKGTSETTFAPDAVCNRGQIVTFLWRFAGEKAPEKTGNPFTDVAEGKFYYSAVLWAVDAGVTKGVTETAFQPDTTCSRGQVVTFLYRATADKKDAEPETPAFDANDTVVVSFDVTNTGAVKGKEVAQLYVAQPDAPAELIRPIRRLKGFDKIELEPGETKTVTLEVKIPDLAYYSEENDRFEVDTGRYQIQVGEDSAHATLTEDFSVTGELEEYPVVLTAKPNQTGDQELGIEQRLIFDKGVEIDPQLTVAMNNEKLYGYIIKEQTSIIKSLQSTPMPEGMTFTYESNRPNVCKVEDGKIVTVGAGVATVTATATYNGHTASTEFVVYVMSNVRLDGILIDGEPLAKFNPDKYSYTVTLPNKAHKPVVTATAANPDLRITVKQVKSLPGTATITTKDPVSGVSATYEINFKVKASSGGGTTTIDFTDEADAGKYEIVGQTQSEISQDGLPLISTRNSIEPAKGQNSGDQASTPEDLVQIPVAGDWTATLEVDFSQNGARNGYYQFFGFYAGSGESYENLAGIRGGDGAMQNFLREDGTVTHEDESEVNSSPGFANEGIYFLRIEKVGTTYICSRSDDNEEWTEMFTYEDTGIEAEYIIIDAYTGMTAGYKWTLKYLTIEGVGGGAAGLPDIDFTSLADADKYEVWGDAPTGAAAEEGVGLALTATQGGVEPAKQNIAEANNDVVVVPVSGDWTATLEVEFDANSARNGYYQFFGFYAAMGDDWQNLVGIRGGDGAMQDFIRLDGAITEETKSSSPGFDTTGKTYYLRIEKVDTTYICSRSDDGEEFTEMFSYEETGIESDFIVIDAYTGMTEGYKFILKYLGFEGGASGDPGAEPEVSAITANGEDVGFIPEVAVYNLEVPKDSAAAPVVAVQAGNSATKITIEQLSGPFGTAVVTATAGSKTKTYYVSFNHTVESDYLADGGWDESLWGLDNPDPESFSIVEGKGIALLDQLGEWKNVPTMAGMGNWALVAKVFMPKAPEDAADNAILEIREYGERSAAVSSYDMDAAEDGTLTVFFKVERKDGVYTFSRSADGLEYETVSTDDTDFIDPRIAIKSGSEAYVEYVCVTSANGIEEYNMPQMLQWAAQNAADYIAASFPDTADAGTVILPALPPHGYSYALSADDPAIDLATGQVTQGSVEKQVKITVTVNQGSVAATAEKTVTIPAAG